MYSELGLIERVLQTRSLRFFIPRWPPFSFIYCSHLLLRTCSPV